MNVEQPHPLTALERAAQAAQAAEDALKAQEALTIRMNLADQRVERLERRQIKEQDTMQALLSTLVADVHELQEFHHADQEERKRRQEEADKRAAQRAARDTVISKRVNILLQIGGGTFLLALGTFANSIKGDAQRYIPTVALIVVVLCLCLVVVALYQAGRGKDNGANPDN